MRRRPLGDRPTPAPARLARRGAHLLQHGLHLRHRGRRHPRRARDRGLLSGERLHRRPPARGPWHRRLRARGLGGQRLPVLAGGRGGGGQQLDGVSGLPAQGDGCDHGSDEAEAGAHAEGEVEAVCQRAGARAMRAARVRASAIVESTASPSAPPISREVFSSPEPTPLCARGSHCIATIVAGTSERPIPIAESRRRGGPCAR